MSIWCIYVRLLAYSKMPLEIYGDVLIMFCERILWVNYEEINVKLTCATNKGMLISVPPCILKPHGWLVSALLNIISSPMFVPKLSLHSWSLKFQMPPPTNSRQPNSTQTQLTGYFLWTVFSTIYLSESPREYASLLTVRVACESLDHAFKSLKIPITVRQCSPVENKASLF